MSSITYVHLLVRYWLRRVWRLPTDPCLNNALNCSDVIGGTDGLDYDCTCAPGYTSKWFLNLNDTRCFVLKNHYIRDAFMPHCDDVLRLVCSRSQLWRSGWLCKWSMWSLRNLSGSAIRYTLTSSSLHLNFRKSTGASNCPLTTTRCLVE